MKSLLKVYKRFSTSREIPEPKIPKGIISKIFGHYKELHEYGKANNTNLLLSISDKREDYYKQTNSKIFKIRMINDYYIYSACADTNKAVLVEKQADFENAGLAFKKVFGHYFPESVLVVEGEKWIRIRKVLQRAINKSSIDPFIPFIIESSNSIFKNFDPNNEQTVNLMNRLTFDSFHSVMYGWNPETLSNNPESLELLRNCEIIGKSIEARLFDISPLLWKLPTKTNKDIKNASTFVRKFTLDFIEKEKNLKESKVKNSFLREILLATKFEENTIEGQNDKENKYINASELYDNISTFFFGAYGTTSNTLRYILWYLGKYPEYQEKLRNEIINFYKDKKFTETNMSQLNSLEYLNFFIDEVNRLTPFLPFVQRYALKDTEVNGYKISKDVEINIDFCMMAQNPDFYGGQTDLKNFRPCRWGEFKPHPLKGILPFGHGGRICPGKMIALAEMKTFICYILQNYKVVLRNPEEKLQLDCEIGFIIKKGFGNVNFVNI